MKSYFNSLSRDVVSTEIPLDYILINPLGEKLFILLHGYKETAEIILKKLKFVLPENISILAINGIYPIIEKIEEHRSHYKIRFAWYLYDNFEDEYLVDQRPATTAVQNLITKLGALKKPKTIVGYSQGGYFAPFLANKLENVDQVVGVACHFLKDEFDLPQYQIDGLHGKLDATVDPVSAQRSHAELVRRGAKGRFLSIEGEGHKLTPEFVSNLKKLWI